MESLEQRILSAINSWPNKAWLVLPGPTDLGPQLARHIARHLGDAPEPIVPSQLIDLIGLLSMNAPEDGE